MSGFSPIYDQYMYSYPHKTAYRPLAHISLEDYLNRLSGEQDTLYFHIPFCQTKCGYCNLFSVPGQEEGYIQQYLEAMERQCEQYGLKDGVSFRNLVLGGGTPLLLSVAQLEQIFQMAERYCHTSSKRAFTVVETSPNQTQADKLACLKEYGCNRVSIGVQSFHAAELETLGRRHSGTQAQAALRLLKEFAFDVVNVDLIYGIPGQTMDSLQESLEKALFFDPEEIFIYPLYIQKHTAMYRQGWRPNEQTLQMYQAVRKWLHQAGYAQSSMRRFTKAPIQQEGGCGFETTLAIGCGGRSYLENLHCASPYAVESHICRKIIDKYIQKTDYKQVENGYLLSQEEQKRRYVIKNLLHTQGIEEKEYTARFDGDLLEDFPQLREMTGSICREQGFVKLTQQGLALSDTIGPSLISQEVRKSMMQYETDQAYLLSRVWKIL